MEKDADKRAARKFTHRRLEAEEIRDSMLAIAGPPEPKARRAQRDGADRSRHGAGCSSAPQYWVPTRDKSEVIAAPYI